MRHEKQILLVFPAQSYRLSAFLEAAERSGVGVVLATDLPGPFLKEGHRVLAVDFSDPEGSADALVGALAGAPPAGAIGTHEGSAVIAALVCERLGLPHSSAEGTYAARDKRRMREILAREGVPSPRFRVVLPEERAEDVAREVRFPCVVKPTMLTGSQGVIRADDPPGLASALHRVRAILRRHPSELTALDEFHRILVEDYLPGKEVSVEAIVTRGELTALAVFDKPDELVGPFFEETIYVTPSRLAAEEQAEVLAVAGKAARALGLSHGPVHAELRVDGGRAAIVEIAARSMGGLCSRTLELCAGSLEEILVAHALGGPEASLARRGADLGGEPRAAGVMMIPIPRSGVLRAVHGEAEARAVPGIVGVEIAVPPGASIRALPEGSSYLGFLFARGEAPEEVERALRAAHAALRFDLTPLLALL